MICLSLQDVSFEIGAKVLLEKISFAINEGIRLGIVGDNGAGKSTLLKLITGEYEPTEGKVFVANDTRIGMLGQNQVCESELPLYDFALSVFRDLTQLEDEIADLEMRVEDDYSLIGVLADAREKFSSKGGFEFRSRARGTLISLGFSEDDMSRSVSSFSGGQKTRIALAILLLSNPNILILDEPTNHLDTEAMDWLATQITNYRGTVIVVSHDRYFLDQIATDIYEIEYLRGRMWHGNYSSFAEQKKKDKEVRTHHYLNQQKEIKRIEEYIAQQRRWNRERNIIAAESREKQLAKMEKLDRPEGPTDSIKLRFAYAGESANRVVTMRSLGMSYGKKKLFENYSTIIKKGERAFICGENGCGKSTLVKILAHKVHQTSGIFDWGENTLVGYYDQENQNLDRSKTVLDELWDEYPSLTHTEVRNALALLLFKGEDVIKQISVISGGEAARLTLAKLSLKGCNVLLLDEPTNHLDISSREVLEEALQNFEGTIICVSHDRYFINKLATRIIEFTPDGVSDFDGSFADWRMVKLATSDKLQVVEASDAKLDFERQKREAAEKRKAEAKIARAQKESEEIEKRLAEIDILCEENPTDVSMLTELYAEKEKLEEKLLECYESLI